MDMNFNLIQWTDTFLKDFDAGRRFYSELFDWQFVDQYDNDQLVYSIACLNSAEESLNGAIVAGVGPCSEPLPGGVPWNWGVYVLVENVEDKIDRVIAAGGRICKEPMDVMEAGRMAVCLDTGGTVIHLWQPLAHAGADVGDVPNAVCWVELSSADVQQSIAFYGDVFGWSAKEHHVNDKTYWQFMAGDSIVGGMHDRVEEVGGQLIWMPYFKSIDVDAQLDTCMRLGGTVVLSPISEAGIGKFAIVTDPENNMFGLAEFG